MDITKLRYFRTVAELGNISAAARVLYLSHPALSKMISKMEQELDVTLFQRNGNSLKLNENGKRFYNFAIQTIDAYDECLADLHFPTAKQPLCIAYTSDINLELQIDACQSQFPEVPFTPQLCTGDKIFTLEQQHAVHIAFMSGIGNGPPGWSMLIPLRWCLVAHRDHPLMQECTPLSVSDISSYTAAFWGERESFDVFRQIYQYRKADLSKLIYGKGDASSVMALARNSVCGILNYSAASGLFKARPHLHLTLRVIEDDMLQRNICAKITDILPEGAIYQSIVQTLCQMIRDSYEQDVADVISLMRQR